MEPKDSNKREHPTEEHSAKDKVTDKAKEIFGTGDSKDGSKSPFQKAPDEGEGDVPKGDKVIKDHATGEERVIRNTGDKY